MDALSWLTLALVGVTAYYGYETYQMVTEMRKARGVAVLPKPAPTMTYLAPDVAMPTIVNAGPGAAIDVYVEMWLDPGNGHRRQWRTPLLAPGERHEFFLEKKGGSGLGRMSEVTKEYRYLRMRGTCRDPLGASHTFDDTADIREWWNLLQESGERLQPDHPKEIADSLKTIAKSLKK
jgi:hypothetical protein